MNSRILRGGKLLVIFGPCDPKSSMKGASENFGSMTKLALVIEIYLPREFHKFSPSRFWETPERGGVPLRKSSGNFSWSSLELYKRIVSVTGDEKIINHKTEKLGDFFLARKAVKIK